MIAFFAACGGGGGGAHPAAADDGAPSCKAVAAHLVILAERDNGATAGDELGEAIYSEAERQCNTAPWTPARRTCLAAAPAQDDTLACPAD